MNDFRKRRWGFRPSRPHGGKDRRPNRQRSARPQLEVLEDRQLLAVFTVTTTNEFVAGSLRQAILDANAHPGLNTIAFNIGGGGVQTIQPQLDLPTITNPVIIDGTTQPGYAGSPLIALRGGYAGTGLLITAGNSTVKGLVFNSFGGGIVLRGAGGNVITGNYLGTDITGTIAVGNNCGIDLGTSNNTVGGTTPGARNLISGNSYCGVETGGGQSNVVEGNYIGTDVTGNLPLGNMIGLDVADNSTIGGTAPGAGNVISGNGTGIYGGNHMQVQGNLIGTNPTGTRAVGNRIGIRVSEGTVGGTGPAARNLISGNSVAGVVADGALIEGNYVGTDVTGNAALGNVTGIDIEPGNRGSTVGGTVAGAGNVISGNSFRGIDATGLQLEPNLIQGNLIGTNAAGTAVVGDGVGVYIYGRSSNLIGGTTAQAGNVISGNAIGVWVALTGFAQIEGNSIGTDPSGTRALSNGEGVMVEGSATVGGTAAGAGNLISGNADNGVAVYSSGNLIQGNFIGVDRTGTASLSNVTGVYLIGSNNLVGGTAPGARNIISGNAPPSEFQLGGTGLWISGAGATGNRVQGNYIGTNAAGTAAVANVFDGILLDGQATGNTIGGEVAGAGNLISGNGQVGLLIDQSSGNPVEGNFIGTDWTGQSAIPNQFGIEVNSGRLTASVIGGTAPGDRNVISGNMGGIVGFNVNILGNYIGTDVTGTRALGNVGAGISVGYDGSGMEYRTIGGTVPGAGNLISGNGTGLSVGGKNIVIEGNLIGTDVSGMAPLGNGEGIYLGRTSNQVTIGGSMEEERNVISASQMEGIYLDSGRATIEGNWIGTDITGMAALGNLRGVTLSIYDPEKITLGGSGPGEGNLISGNQQEGVLIQEVDPRTGSSQAILEGNLIGTDATGRAALGNGVGVRVEGSQNTIGGTQTGAGNVISGNEGAGIVFDVFRYEPGENYVLGNFIGTDVSGGFAVPNGGDGIRVIGTLNAIGGTVPGARNVISGNVGNGVAIGGFGNSYNRVQGNWIGVDATGVNPLGNGGDGVLIMWNGSDAIRNTVGGTEAHAGNVIANNGGDGVRVDGGTANAIQGNAIYSHADGLGIELVHNGNNNQPAPVLTAAQSDRSGTTVMGTFTGRANTSFALEFFSNTACNPSGYGEGEVFLGTLTVTTDAAGDVSFMTHFSVGAGHRRYLAATATDPNSNTSAFSRCVVASGRGHQGGDMDRAGAPPSDLAAVLRHGVGSPANTSVSMTLTDPSRESVDRDTVPGMVASDEDQSQRLSVADAWPPTPLGSDLFFSGLGQEGAGSVAEGATSASLLDATGINPLV